MQVYTLVGNFVNQYVKAKPRMEVANRLIQQIEYLQRVPMYLLTWRIN